MDFLFKRRKTTKVWLNRSKGRQAMDGMNLKSRIYRTLLKEKMC